MAIPESLHASGLISIAIGLRSIQKTVKPEYREFSLFTVRDELPLGYLLILMARPAPNYKKREKFVNKSFRFFSYDPYIIISWIFDTIPALAHNYHIV